MRSRAARYARCAPRHKRRPRLSKQCKHAAGRRCPLSGRGPGGWAPCHSGWVDLLRGEARPSGQQQDGAADKLGEEVSIHLLVVHRLRCARRWAIRGKWSRQWYVFVKAAAAASPSCRMGTRACVCQKNHHNIEGSWPPPPTWECSTSRSASTSSATSPAKRARVASGESASCRLMLLCGAWQPGRAPPRGAAIAAAGERGDRGAVAAPGNSRVRSAAPAPRLSALPHLRPRWSGPPPPLRRRPPPAAPRFRT